MLAGMENRVRRWLYGRSLLVWYAPEYRWPLSALEPRTGFEPRRADFAAWFLLEHRALGRRNLRTPRRAEYQELARVHTADLLESLGRPETLARIFSVDPIDLPVDETMRTVRMVCGATIDAAREMVAPAEQKLGRRAINLLGGFHHARPDVAGGFCPVNDVAVAVAAVRAEGFRGRVLVLDLDAHPPDGTAACLAGDPSSWIGSLSGSDWGTIPGADETVLPERAGDAQYLAALDALLRRMPSGELAFVIAGGDVLAADPLGRVGLTLQGCRERDLRVADELFRVPSVWLPGGGYSPDAWKVLAGTGLALGVRSRAPIPAGYDPLVAKFSAIARSLVPAELGDPGTTEMDDVAEQLGIPTPRRQLLLGFYSAEGLEHALYRYGVLQELRRLGFGPFRPELRDAGVGQGARLIDVPTGEPLIEVVLQRKQIGGARMLYVHWLTLRNPRARFSPDRPQLPGQDVPGLGLAREMMELLVRMAARLQLEGIAFRPASYHLAFGGRETLRFVDPARQGRFEALIELLQGLPLIEATRAVAEGRVLLEGKPYQWEADEMVKWIDPRPDDRAAIDAAKSAARFTLAPRSGGQV